MNPGPPVLQRRVSGIVRLIRGQEIYLSRGWRLLHSDDGGESWRALPPLPVPPRPRLLSCHRWLRRLTRLDLHHLVRLPDGSLVALGFGRFWRLETGARAWVALGRAHGRRPLAVAVDQEGNLFYGEYLPNRERQPIRIWMSRDRGDSWETVWTFANVRHVHGVFWDEYERSLWVTTGDDDHECALWRTRDRFGTLERVLGGSQDFRIVQPLFTRDHIVFGSDGPDIQNHLWRLDRRMREPIRTQTVPGPVFYGARAGAGLFFATIVEPSPVNHGRDASLWHSSDDGCSWQQVAAWRKDFLPKRAFQYGQVLFPSGQLDSGLLWLTPFATDDDQISHCYEFS